MKPLYTLFTLILCLTSCNATGKSNYDIPSKDEPLVPVIPVYESDNSRFGVTHTGGKYCLTNEPFIVEGAKKLDALGVKTIKFFLSKDMSDHFPYNSDWSATKGKSWVEIVSCPYFDEVFKLNFKTVIFNITDHNQKLSKPDPDFSQSSREIGDLVRYLQKRFADRDITFIIKNWEGDWILRGNTKDEDDWMSVPEADRELRCRNFIKWITSRQEAIDKAKSENPDSKCKVYHALEANKVMSAIDNGVTSISNSVLPYVKTDLVSWSCYDGLSSASDIDKGIRYLGAMHKLKGDFPGQQTVMIGEIGFQEQVFKYDIEKRMHDIYDRCIQLDVPYIVYWELYCNEPKNSSEKNIFYPMKTADQMKGLWLYRPDGSESIACKVLKYYLED